MVRERSDPVASEPEALRAWRSGACGARRPAQTAPNRGKAPAPGRLTPGGRAGEPVPWTTPRSPGRAGPLRMRVALAVRIALAPPAIGAITRAGQRTGLSQGAKWSEGMMLLDNPSPRIDVLCRKGPLSPTLEVLVVR